LLSGNIFSDDYRFAERGTGSQSQGHKLVTCAIELVAHTRCHWYFAFVFLQARRI
jgi:hypothetical protein